MTTIQEGRVKGSPANLTPSQEHSPQFTNTKSSDVFFDIRFDLTSLEIGRDWLLLTRRLFCLGQTAAAAAGFGVWIKLLLSLGNSGLFCATTALETRHWGGGRFRCRFLLGTSAWILREVETEPSLASLHPRELLLVLI
jgi:hypothetical protein